MANVSAFAPMSTTTTTTTTPRRRPTTPCSMVVVDGTLLADGAVAVASFCAGILTQVPRVQALEQNVTETQAAAAAEIAALQERLYALDLEYEQGTQALKESFDTLRVDQLKRQKRKQAAEFQYKLQATVDQMKDDMERKLKEQKADLLAQQLATASANGTDRQAEIMQLRLEQTQLQTRNQKLQSLLQQAQEEIAELQRKEKNPFFAFFGMGQEEPSQGNNNGKMEKSAP